MNDNQAKSMIFNINRNKVTMSCLSDLKYFVISLHDSSNSKFFLIKIFKSPKLSRKLYRNCKFDYQALPKIGVQTQELQNNYDKQQLLPWLLTGSVDQTQSTTVLGQQSCTFVSFSLPLNPTTHSLLPRWCFWSEATLIFHWSELEQPPETEGRVYSSPRVRGGHQLFRQYVCCLLWGLLGTEHWYL